MVSFVPPLVMPGFVQGQQSARASSGRPSAKFLWEGRPSAKALRAAAGRGMKPGEMLRVRGFQPGRGAWAA